MFWFQSQQIKRSLSNSENSIYLTFDDGPSEQSTSQVLDVLNKNQIQSTFFVVVENIKKQTSLTREILSSQHSLLSHSTDHTYQHFFSTKKNLKNWF